MVSFRGLVVASVAIPVGITIWDVLVGFSSVRSQTKESLAEWAFANNPSTIASVVKPWKFPSIAVTTPNNSSMDHHLYTPSMFVESNVLPFCKDLQDWLLEFDADNNSNRTSQSIISDATSRRFLSNAPGIITWEMTSPMMETNLIDQTPALLGQTVCHKDGRFRDTAADAWNASSTTLVHEWELKLIYLAVHALHHQPALQEHRERLQCMEDTDTTTATLIKQHSYQYECQNAKFLVTDLVNQGMGAAIRLSGVAHVLMGIASDRIPLFVANASQGPSFLQQPWKLASCPRNDLQCVFLPTSPCTLSIEELANATVLDELSARSLRRGGSLPKQYQNDKVLIYQARVAPAKFDQFRGIHNAVRKRIYLEAIELVKEWKTANPHNTEQLGVLQQAAQRIQKGDSADSYNHYEYGHRYYRIAHAILLYLLRPNLHSQQDIKAQLEAIVPTSLDPHNALGMPIRGTHTII